SPSVNSSRFAFISLSVGGESTATQSIARSGETGKHAVYGVLTVSLADTARLATRRILALTRQAALSCAP
ncbi:MAG: hypothetical protein ACYCUE_00005, partial [Steroidobacteraceae bacterium]